MRDFYKALPSMDIPSRYFYLAKPPKGSPIPKPVQTNVPRSEGGLIVYDMELPRSVYEREKQIFHPDFGICDVLEASGNKMEVITNKGIEKTLVMNYQKPA